ncbi:hypothetical protein LCGC14_1377600, partial [marine sediment metagenome]
MQYITLESVTPDGLAGLANTAAKGGWRLMGPVLPVPHPMSETTYLGTMELTMEDMLDSIKYKQRSDPDPEDLLRLYATVRRRLPWAQVYEGGARRGLGRVPKISPWMRGETWLRHRTALLLGQIGRHGEAATLTAPAIDRENRVHGERTCLLSAIDHYARTGKTLPPDVLIDPDFPRGWWKDPPVSFRPDSRTREIRPRRPLKVGGQNVPGIDTPQWEASRPLIAPSGYVFTALRLFPIAEGTSEGTVWAQVRLWGIARDIVRNRERLSVARTKGLLCDDLPHAGMLDLKWWISTEGPDTPPVLVRGLRVVAKLKKIETPGAVRVQCTNTWLLRIDVDGSLVRWYPGLVGPLAPGRHTLKVSPCIRGSIYEPWTGEVTVRAGQVTPLTIELPMRRDSAWSAWQSTLVGRDYAGFNHRLHKPRRAPVLLLDDQAIRILWSHWGDLWSSVSTDGKTYSRPRKLPSPVSTAWLETAPLLALHESGRFVLVFVSDRDAQHRKLVYFTWSRDFRNWSAPMQIPDRNTQRWGTIR